MIRNKYTRDYAGFGRNQQDPGQIVYKVPLFIESISRTPRTSPRLIARTSRSSALMPEVILCKEKAPVLPLDTMKQGGGEENSDLHESMHVGSWIQNIAYVPTAWDHAAVQPTADILKNVLRSAPSHPAPSPIKSTERIRWEYHPVSHLPTQQTYTRCLPLLRPRAPSPPPPGTFAGTELPLFLRPRLLSPSGVHSPQQPSTTSFNPSRLLGYSGVCSAIGACACAKRKRERPSQILRGASSRRKKATQRTSSGGASITAGTLPVGE